MEKVLAKIFAFGVVISAAVLLMACSGGDAGDTAESVLKKGRFVDDAVANLKYEINGEFHYTDNWGFFQYHEGDVLGFYVGDIFLGEAPGARVITPVELVPQAQDETHATVVNMARFLQTIDAKDEFESNHILLITDEMHSAASGKNLNFEQNISDFELDEELISIVELLTALTPTGIKLLIGSETARQNLKSNLLGARGGTYNGRFSGDMTGTFGLDLYSGFSAVSGTVVGYMCDTQQQLTHKLVGEYSSNGDIVFSIEGQEGVVFSGSVLVNGQMGGDWLNGDSGGLFSATKGVLDPNMAWCAQKLATNRITLSGPDTRFTGNSFVPFHDTTGYYNGDPNALYLSQGSGIDRWGIISIEGNLSNVNGHYTGSIHFTWSHTMDWYLDCGDFLQRDDLICDRITLDEQAQTLTFNNAEFPVCEPRPDIGWCAYNDATAPLRVNGVLSYTIHN